MKIKELLDSYQEKCDEKQKEMHALRLLLMDVLAVESYELYAMLSEDMDEQKRVIFEKAANRYLEHNEPIQYILGHEYFAGRNLYVDAGVLIPRPETEELVYELLFLIDELFADYAKINAVDIGTGSGAIAISLAAEAKKLDMWATDISEEALSVARKNAESYAKHVQFLAGDMLEPLKAQGVTFDILVSNPPYIPENEHVQDIVRDNEPEVALFGGKDGLYFYRKILSEAKGILNEKYLLGFEIGFNQATALTELAKSYFPNDNIWIKKDMQGKDRMLFVTNMKKRMA